MRIITRSEEETAALGEKLASKITGGEIFALEGEMGSGKTAFVKGVMRGLGYKEEVTSPTFSICHVYETTPIVYHYDLYRMTSLDDIFSTGLFDSCDENSVLFIEWARDTEELGEEVKTLYFSYGKKINERIIEAEDGIF